MNSQSVGKFPKDWEKLKNVKLTDKKIQSTEMLYRQVFQRFLKIKIKIGTPVGYIETKMKVLNE